MIVHKRKISIGRKLPVAFSKSFDNGEILKPRITRSMQYVVQASTQAVPFEEYVVPAAPVSARSPVDAAPSAGSPSPAISTDTVNEKTAVGPKPPSNGGAEADKEIIGQPPAPLPQRQAGPPPAITDTAKLGILDRIGKENPLADAATPAGATQPARGAAPAQSASISKQSDFDRFHAEPSSGNNSTDEDDFVKDMQAIMRGEKVYNKDVKATESRSQKPAEPAMPNSLSQMENKQAIFDQIAESMTYAKAYDLGNIDLDKRFNDFDKSAEKREAFYRSASMANKQPVVEPSPGYPVYPPTANASNAYTDHSPVYPPSRVGGEEFLVDLNSIARAKAIGQVGQGQVVHGQVVQGTVYPGQVYPGQVVQTQVARKKEYLFEQAGMTFSKAAGYSYMQNPAMIAGIAVSDAIQIGLGAVSVAQAGVSSMAGSFSLTFDKAQRLLTTEARAQMPGSQTSKLVFREEVLWIGEQKPGFANATIVVEWEGNAYGEIGTAVISRDLDKSTDWTQSSCNIGFTRLEKIPQPGTDPRTWPVVYRYEGTYNPLFNGKYEFEGEFEINAFGGLLHTRHHVVDRSALEFVKIGEPEEYVVQRPSVLKQIPQIPAEQVAYLKTKLP